MKDKFLFEIKLKRLDFTTPYAAKASIQLQRGTKTIETLEKPRLSLKNRKTNLQDALRISTKLTRAG